MIGSKFYSQSLYLNFKPGYSFAFGTWKERIIYETPEDKFEIYDFSQLGKISFGYRAFCGSLDIVKYKKILFGVDYFKSSAISGHNVKYYVTPPVENPFINGKAGVKSKGVHSTNIYQVGVHATYQFKSANRINHELTFGSFLQFDRTSYEIGPFYFNSDLVDGNYFTKSYPDTSFANKKSFCMQFRYDLSVNTKKQKNIFSVFILFQQGFREMGRKYNEFHHSLGYDLTIASTSKSSGFYIGLCKPILLYDNTKKKKNES